MKTNIKMRVTPEQSKKVQEICFENGIAWRINKKKFSHLDAPYLGIEEEAIFYRSTKSEYNITNLEEIDADLFIKTNGTCEENNSSIDYETLRLSHLVLNSKYEELEQKLKKKNEILKKARIKRKNQREELCRLNLKLQKCISLEEHRKVINWHIERNESLFAEIDNLKAENIGMGKLVNLNKSALDLAVITKELAMNEIERKNKEIEKLKAVIEYLESKVNNQDINKSDKLIWTMSE